MPILVRDLANLYKEAFYSIKYISNNNGKALQPLYCSMLSDHLIVKGFQAQFDEEDQTWTLIIAVDPKQYQELKKDE